jgi:hypothetical protein
MQPALIMMRIPRYGSSLSFDTSVLCCRTTAVAQLLSHKCCRTTAVAQRLGLLYSGSDWCVKDCWRLDIPVDLRAWLGVNKAKFPRVAWLFEEGKEHDVARCLLALAEDAKSR